MSELIDRQAAIDAVNTALFPKINTAKDAEKALRGLPTIAAKPVQHGRWSRERLPSTSGGSYEVFRCSECQMCFNWRMRYCGHCGAKMDGGDEHE